jgi:hypothetical protein
MSVPLRKVDVCLTGRFWRTQFVVEFHSIFKQYIKWGRKKADWYDPLDPNRLLQFHFARPFRTYYFPAH